MSKRAISCLACGAVAPSGTRCPECGAEVVRLELHEARRESSFDVKVFFASLVLFALAVGAVVVALPFVLRVYDPQGVPGFLIASGMYFVLGLGLGRALGPEAYVEPALAAGIVSGALVPYMQWAADVRAMHVGYYVAGVALGCMTAALGSFLGERRAPST